MRLSESSLLERDNRTPKWRLLLVIPEAGEASEELQSFKCLWDTVEPHLP
jgi:hypothetical protein